MIDINFKFFSPFSLELLMTVLSFLYSVLFRGSSNCCCLFYFTVGRLCKILEYVLREKLLDNCRKFNNYKISLRSFDGIPGNLNLEIFRH